MDLLTRHERKAQLLKWFDFLLLISLYPTAYLLKIYKRLGRDNLGRTSRFISSQALMVYPEDFYEVYEQEFKNNITKNNNRKIENFPKVIKRQKEFIERFENLLELNNNKERINSISKIDETIIRNFILQIKPQNILVISSNKYSEIAKKVVIEQRGQTIETHVFSLNEQVDEFEKISKYATNLTFKDLIIFHSNGSVPPSKWTKDFFNTILPNLSTGVFIAFTEILTPHRFENDWIEWNISSWSCQSLLESILSNSDSLDIHLPAFFSYCQVIMSQSKELNYFNFNEPNLFIVQKN